MRGTIIDTSRTIVALQNSDDQIKSKMFSNFPQNCGSRCQLEEGVHSRKTFESFFLVFWPFLPVLAFFALFGQLISCLLGWGKCIFLLLHTFWIGAQGLFWCMCVRTDSEVWCSLKTPTKNTNQNANYANIDICYFVVRQLFVWNLRTFFAYFLQAQKSVGVQKIQLWDIKKNPKNSPES